MVFPGGCLILAGGRARPVPVLRIATIIRGVLHESSGTLGCRSCWPSPVSSRCRAATTRRDPPRIDRSGSHPRPRPAPISAARDRVRRRPATGASCRRPRNCRRCCATSTPPGSPTTPIPAPIRSCSTRDRPGSCGTSRATRRDSIRPIRTGACLACHTTPRPSKDLVATEWMNADAVGCESCHGASRRWLGPHTTGDDWRKRPWSEKAELGFQDTKDLVGRTRLCVGCHVGDAGSGEMPAREVNHDLIAAGHPRLYFELSAYLDNMPAHWIEKGINGGVPTRSDPRPSPAADFPARAWAVGHLVALEASLKLLESRAARAGAAESPPRHRSRPARPPGPSSRSTAASPAITTCAIRPGAARLGPTVRCPARRDGAHGASPRPATWWKRSREEPEAQTYTESLRRLSSLMEQPVPHATAIARERGRRPVRWPFASRKSPEAIRRRGGRAVDRPAGSRGCPGSHRELGRGRPPLPQPDPVVSILGQAGPRPERQPGPAPGPPPGLARKLAFPPRFDSPKEFDPAKISRPGR